MRYAIWQRDDFFDIGGLRVDMDPSVVELPEEAPLSWMFNWNDAAGQYGIARDIRLEDGEITCELFVMDPSFNPALMEEQNIRLGGFYTNVCREMESDGVNRVDTVTSCELKAVSIILKPITPFFKEQK